jgi:hypothetical protein
VFAVLSLAPLVTAALFAAAGTSTQRTLSAPELVVTRDTISLPMGCSPREVGTLLLHFMDAFNAGNREALERVVAVDGPPGSQAPIYSVTERRYGATAPWRHRAFFDRGDLFAYFAGRHAQNERMALVEVQVRPSSRPRAVGLVVKVRREADDLPRWLSPFAVVKGGIDCAEGAIDLWNMGQSSRDEIAYICPHPLRWKPGAPPVVCSGGPNAAAVAPGFVVTPARVNLPPRCNASAVERRVRGVLSVFNLGFGPLFAKHFALRGQFHPYTSAIKGTNVVGRGRIASFVRARYRKGDGWTASRPLSPQGSVGLPKHAVYGLEFRVSYQGAVIAEQVGAKLVIDCRSGLLQTWVGPSLKIPPGSA